jgi:class 3 adenylate cyclase
MTGIAEWLASIGLEEYARRFADNAVDLSILRDLTEQDLKDLGVLLGHRRKLLRAIAELDPASLVTERPAIEPVPRDEGERRHLTVMFCDLVGSTALSARLDPEDMWRLLASYHACISGIIGRFQGLIARYMGDGVLAYFGYPSAQEDDAEQAVRAALALVEGVANLRTRQAHNWKRRSEARPIAAHMQRRAVRRRHQDARKALVRIDSANSQWSSSLQMDAKWSGTTTFVPVAEARRVPP